MAKTGSSKRWLIRQANDEFTAKARQAGYRSRAVYKLQEIDEKDKIFSPGMRVVDLGAAPGGWSQFAIKKVEPGNGRVFSVDLLSMDSIFGVDIMQGDFSKQETVDQLLTNLDNKKINVVICDLAPNLSGIRDVDQSSIIYLVELALDFSIKVLNFGGSFVIKIFQGEGFDNFLMQIRSKFAKVKIRKPKASRTESREVYIVAFGFKQD